MPYSQKLKQKMDAVQKTGFPIFSMLHLFKKKSSLRIDIPEAVIDAVCMEYFKRQGVIDKTFPYFLIVLKNETRRYFAKESQSEGLRHKSQPIWLGEFFKNVKT